MLRSGEKVYAYKFEGYWKDVGTIDSLWQANMDLLGENGFELSDENWIIYSRHAEKPPHYTGKDAVIKNSIVSEGAAIFGTVENSIIFSGVSVGENAFVKDSVIMADVEINKNCVINYSIIDEMVKIGAGLKIGRQMGKDSEITVIPRESVINKMGGVI